MGGTEFDIFMVVANALAVFWAYMSGWVQPPENSRFAGLLKGKGEQRETGNSTGKDESKGKKLDSGDERKNPEKYVFDELTQIIKSISLSNLSDLKKDSKDNTTAINHLYESINALNSAQQLGTMKTDKVVGGLMDVKKSIDLLNERFKAFERTMERHLTKIADKIGN